MEIKKVDNTTVQRKFSQKIFKFLMASFDKYCKMYSEKFKFSTLLKHAL
jgi:hypothetical protein